MARSNRGLQIGRGLRGSLLMQLRSKWMASFPGSPLPSEGGAWGMVANEPKPSSIIELCTLEWFAVWVGVPSTNLSTYCSNSSACELVRDDERVRQNQRALGFVPAAMFKIRIEVWLATCLRKINVTGPVYNLVQSWIELGGHHRKLDRKWPVASCCLELWAGSWFFVFVTPLAFSMRFLWSCILPPAASDQHKMWQVVESELKMVCYRVFWLWSV